MVRCVVKQNFCVSSFSILVQLILIETKTMTLELLTVWSNHLNELCKGEQS